VSWAWLSSSYSARNFVLLTPKWSSRLAVAELDVHSVTGWSSFKLRCTFEGAATFHSSVSTPGNCREQGSRMM
jgi:hypothetical protein